MFENYSDGSVKNYYLKLLIKKFFIKKIECVQPTLAHQCASNLKLENSSPVFYYVLLFRLLPPLPLHINLSINISGIKLTKKIFARQPTRISTCFFRSISSKLPESRLFSLHKLQLAKHMLYSFPFPIECLKLFVENIRRNNVFISLQFL